LGSTTALIRQLFALVAYGAELCCASCLVGCLARLMLAFGGEHLKLLLEAAGAAFERCFKGRKIQ